MQTYHLFISHSWNYAHAHDNLVRLLGAKPDFSFKNFSVPPHNPIMGAQTDKQLEEAIENKIRPCSAVLIMAGMYSTYSKWINKEIEIAKRMGKVIIAIKPFGAERISTVVREAAHAECAWNTNSIVSAIRLHTAV
ncbi:MULTISPECIES: TIR domain-containing protein [Pseudomonas]|uniref:TIR domain-containing protein n=1 Tax=Pseudomonas TaxID=286 RepID=UPI000D4BA4FB|nr:MULTISPECIES: TIR domain-containing protein [Pseudomonas]PTT64387.1 molecular chaperone Tir [Pseudomonas sp. HMWF007]PTT93681.1 molecular chaperone Tir [Pseudomonas sp. HMWF005]RON59583.1 molecular chaperone Tir [Pseudomonas fluorescens]PTS93521.1 molecular chaperone Tir [Pseudomonas sp. HMWF006]QXI01088.1 TIR domain-containing protein [Pseudomonas monsensis]